MEKNDGDLPVGDVQDARPGFFMHLEKKSLVQRLKGALFGVISILISGQEKYPGAHFPHYTTPDTEDKYKNRVDIANAISDQIWREQQLVSSRMQWIFTFNTILPAIYIYAASSLHGAQSLITQCVVSILGFAVAYLTLRAVGAAQRQSSRLKQHWVSLFYPGNLHDNRFPTLKKVIADPGLCNVRSGAFVQPFSTSVGSRQGRLASKGTCVALMIAWLFLLGAAFVSSRSRQPDVLSCQVDWKSADDHLLTIKCPHP